MGSRTQHRNCTWCANMYMRGTCCERADAHVHVHVHAFRVPPHPPTPTPPSSACRQADKVSTCISRNCHVESSNCYGRIAMNAGIAIHTRAHTRAHTHTLPQAIVYRRFAPLVQFQCSAVFFHARWVAEHSEAKFRPKGRVVTGGPYTRVSNNSQKAGAA